MRIFSINRNAHLCSSEITDASSVYWKPGPHQLLLFTFTMCQRSVSEHDAKCSERGGSHEGRYSSDSNVQDNGCGRHFLFDKRWKNGEFRDEVYLKTSSIMTPLPRAYQSQKSLYRISLCRQNKPSRSFCPFEGYNITSFQSRLLPATSTVTEKTFSVEPLRHRPRINNRTSSLFSVAGNQKNHSFPDPVAGAPSSFIQRLSEISSMEGETIRQEKAKRTKKIKKAD
ncbi:uncharacterized protein si:ch211-171b20.3 isoform X2 [Engraulis encrasicolus]|uniref:uncharacterized protein si:ch211-171b20.3 isoform X2 n=1 Tax=Engraulis encrasicolus TaxID=184585 RepID=UPI002FD02CA0